MRAATEIQTENIGADVAGEQSHTAFRSSAFSALIFSVLVAACCAWILQLPVFPSQDGPVHVYYAHVTRDLLLGHHTYAQQFRIARPFPPYSVHAYVLMGLLSFTSGAMAEKLLACLTVIVCGAGLFFFARQLGPSAMVACIAAPFLLNRYLFLGFYGYLIAMGTAMVAMGMWLRPDGRTRSRRIVFLLLVVLTLFSHPVPYLLLIAFCWMAVAAGCWNARRGNAEGVEAPTRGDWITLLLATALFAYIKHYSHSGALWNDELLANWDLRLLRIVDVFRTWDVLPLRNTSYNLMLGGALVGATIAAVRQTRRAARGITGPQLTVGFALLILLALPLLPRTMNGSGFFAERFAIVPPLLLIAAASAVNMSRRMERAAGLISAAILVIALGILHVQIAPVARETAAASAAMPALAGTRVLVTSETRIPREFTWNPYIYAPVRLVDRSGALLADSPWMDLQIMMLDEIGPAARFTTIPEPRLVSPSPVALVDAHCGSFEGVSAASRIAARAPQLWRLMHQGCFDVLEPAR